jgi:hypothetical protein
MDLFFSKDFKKLNYGYVNEFIRVEDIPIKLHVKYQNI